MIEPIPFTRPQRDLIETTASTYVEACPGAGKTQAIVQRFIERPAASARRGVALVSFTNAAVDEARSRCAGRPDLVQAPNFVGTIDSLINRFIVAPVFTSRTGISPVFRDTWRSVPGSTFGVPSVQGRFQLDWFAFSIDGTAAADRTRVSRGRRRLIDGLQLWQRSKVEAEASRLWNRNVCRGIMDAAASRVHAAEFLADDTTRTVLRDLLAHRFCEVIVDEVQDCCDADVQVLRLLLDAGARLILVGDPDQGIYAFRGATAAGLRQLRQLVSLGPRLNGNFRSSPAICGIVDSLRSSAATDKPVGKHAAVELAVVLVTYRTPAQARQQIEEAVSRAGIGHEQLVVLAHSWSTARSCAGAGSDRKTSDNRLYALATAVHEIQDESGTPRVRADALSRLERLLQEQARPGLQDITQAEFTAGLGLSARAYRERVLRFALSLRPPFRSPPSAFKAQLTARRDAQDQLGWTTGGLQTPSHDGWPDIPCEPGDCLTHSTVHGYKGLQSPAVALVIPKRPADAIDQDDGVHQWVRNREGESRRVLYVGASRAQQLLILAVHQSRATDVRTALDRDGVCYINNHEPSPAGIAGLRLDLFVQAEPAGTI